MPRAKTSKAKARGPSSARPPAKKGRTPTIDSPDVPPTDLAGYFDRMEQNLAARLDSMVEARVASALHNLEQRLPPNPGPSQPRTSGITLGQVVNPASSAAPAPVLQPAPTPADGTAVHAPAGSQHIAPSAPGMDVLPANITNQASYPFPLDARVSPKLRAKILANEFIDFGHLINPSKADKSKVQLEEGTDGELSFVRKVGPEGFTQSLKSIQEWDTAFTIYCTVYCSAYPQAMSGLLKFGEMIKRIARRGGDWQHYDVGFRILRQFDPSMPWSHFHGELHGEAMNERPRGSQPFRGPGPAGRKYRVPRGFCTKFHTGGSCSGCAYKHQCPKCGDPHPGYKCSAAHRPRPTGTAPEQQPRPSATPGSSKPTAANASAGQASSGPAGRVRP